MTKGFKMAVALAVLTASLSSAVNAANPNKEPNLTSLCGKIWKPRC